MSSSNKTKQSQSALNFGADESVTDVYAGGSLALVDFSQVQNQSGAVSVSQSGVDSKDVVSLIQQGGAALFEQINKQGTQIANQFSTVSDLVTGITGTQTETGRIVGQLALPVVAVAGLFFLFK